jgi:hypothetical protein
MDRFPARTVSEIVTTFLEYADLSARLSLNDCEAERLEEILIQAVDNPILDFLIIEVDDILLHRQGFLDELSIHRYLDQQALLREYLGTEICSCQYLPKQQKDSEQEPPKTLESI